MTRWRKYFVEKAKAKGKNPSRRRGNDRKPRKRHGVVTSTRSHTLFVLLGQGPQWEPGQNNQEIVRLHLSECNKNLMSYDDRSRSGRIMAPLCFQPRSDDGTLGSRSGDAGSATRAGVSRVIKAPKKVAAEGKRFVLK